MKPMVFIGPSVLLVERRVLKTLTRYHYFVISILISTQEKPSKNYGVSLVLWHLYMKDNQKLKCINFEMELRF